MLGAAPVAAAPPAYCNGQRISSEAGDIQYYPNGQRVVDGFGKQYYPNGTRIVNDYGDEIHYPNGGRVRTMAGELLFPNGTPVKGSSGDARYPNGRVTRDAGGRCFHETGVEMTPCRRQVAIRERLAGGELAAYDLDIVAGAIDLAHVRFRFPSGAAVTVLSANLAKGEIDRQSIRAVCPSGALPR